MVLSSEGRKQMVQVVGGHCPVRRGKCGNGACMHACAPMQPMPTHGPV